MLNGKLKKKEMDILVRFNHFATSDIDRWRFVWDGKEFLVTHIQFQCMVETCKEFIVVNGVPELKYHIRPINANKVIFSKSKNETHVRVL